jgi:L-fuconolactonase
MPDLPIVDAHVHLWDPTRYRMPWLDSEPLLNRPFGLAEYREQTAGLPIEAMVYLQVEVAPAYGLLEAQRAAELAREDPRIGAIVAWAPIEYGDRMRAYLDAVVAVDPRVTGVRRLLQYEPDPQLLLQPDFVRGLQILPEYGLSFDLCIAHRQLGHAIELVRRCPNTQIMLDHLAKPNIKDKVMHPWWEQIAELASLPNVTAKISGAVSDADRERWTIDDLAPYVNRVLEVFGEDRVAFASDWPVVLRASSYRRWVDTVDALTAQWSEAAKRKLWSDNARRFYRLPGA